MRWFKAMFSWLLFFVWNGLLAFFLWKLITKDQLYGTVILMLTLDMLMSIFLGVILRLMKKEVETKLEGRAKLIQYARAIFKGESIPQLKAVRGSTEGEKWLAFDEEWTKLEAEIKPSW